MEKAKRARKAETPKQPSLSLRLRAPYFYPDHRSPASEAGRDSQAPLHADDNCAHGRTRTCTSLVRNQALYPVELRVRDWCHDRDSNSGAPLENRPILATRRPAHWLPDQDSNLD